MNCSALVSAFLEAFRRETMKHPFPKQMNRYDRLIARWYAPEFREDATVAFRAFALWEDSLAVGKPIPKLSLSWEHRIHLNPDFVRDIERLEGEVVGSRALELAEEKHLNIAGAWLRRKFPSIVKVTQSDEQRLHPPEQV